MSIRHTALLSFIMIVAHIAPSAPQQERHSRPNCLRRLFLHAFYAPQAYHLGTYNWRLLPSLLDFGFARARAVVGKAIVYALQN